MKILPILLLLLTQLSLAQNSSIPSVKILNIEWMKENLNVSTFSNGDTIMQATSAE
ncbi:MAG: hypothetical protein RLZ10_1965, partial [Bacteroidota bacterium]